MVAPLSSSTGNCALTKTVILDTDPGVDDAMALLYLAKHPDVRLHSMTTVFGNASVRVTSRNASYLNDHFSLGLPVYEGAAAPLSGPRHISALRVHGSDGFGDTGIATGFRPTLSAKPAWLHIAETIEAHPSEITLLAIAPLTNLALALRHYPAIADKVAEVIVMGGAFGTKGRFGNIRPNAEANFFYDPQAADEVLAGRWPVTVVGLDVTTDCIITSTQSSDLAKSGGDAGKFLHTISRGYEKIYRDFDGIDGFCIHDVAAAVAVTNPAIFGVATGQVEVSSEPDCEGQSLLSLGDYANGMERESQRVCIEVDSQALVDTYIEVMQSALQSPLSGQEGTSIEASLS